MTVALMKNTLRRTNCDDSIYALICSEFMLTGSMCEANEYLKNLEDMFIRHYMRSDIFNMFETSITQ